MINKLVVINHFPPKVMLSPDNPEALNRINNGQLNSIKNGKHNVLQDFSLSSQHHFHVFWVQFVLSCGHLFTVVRHWLSCTTRTFGCRNI